MNAIIESIPNKMWITIIFRLFLLPPVMAIILHWPANDWGWIDGWIVVGTIFLVASFSVVWLTLTNPEIVVERMKGNFQRDQSLPDSIIIIGTSIFMLAIFPVAALDYRFDWYQVGLFWKLAGWLLFLFALWVLYKVFSVNKFLSRSIIIQEKRNQEVVSVGPYRVVRHPMYGALMLFIIGIVLALGSLVALIPAFVSFIFLYFRAVSEEILLESELEGYDKYQQDVKYRIIPKLI